MQTIQADSHADDESIASKKDSYIEQIAKSLENLLQLEIKMIEEDQPNVQ